jgi:RNA polymerase sigma-54 factor
MKTGLSQTARLGQELKINPRLYQAMDMLYMPLLDLQAHLKTELEINPFLELDEEMEELELDREPDEDAESESSEDSDTEERDPVDEKADLDAPEEALPAEAPLEATADDEPDWDTLLDDNYEKENGTTEPAQEDYDPFERVAGAAASLVDSLRDQLEYLNLTPRQRVIANEILGNLDEDGFLGTTPEQIIETLNTSIREAAERMDRDTDELPYYTLAEGEAAITLIQGLEPPGVGARDLRECLLLQFKARGEEGTLAARLVREFFEELVAHRWSDLAKRLGVTPQEVQAASDAVAKLNPKPTGAEANGKADYITPDFVVEKVGGEYLVFINDADLPRVRISRIYQEMARDKKKFDAEQKEFVANKLNAAQWLVSAIEQRRQTMLKVMTFIVERQHDFFEKGVQFLKPLTLREVADAIGMHESTISRVTNDKYAQTPRGVLPLKYFFSSGLATVDGDDVSARGIKATIETLVKNEDPYNPLTDQAIVERLEADGIQIARRTVAKYRDQLGVLSARMRKRV